MDETKGGLDPEDRANSAPRALKVSPEAIETAARLFRAIGDYSRLRLLSLLSQGEAGVSELAAAEKENLSTISQRLRVLRGENLVVRKRRGKYIDYSLADQHVMDLVSSALEHAGEVFAVQGSFDTDEEEEKDEY